MSPVPDIRTRPGPESVGAAAVIRVRFFAHYRDLAGTEACEVRLTGVSTVRDLVEKLRADLHLEAMPAEPLVAVNREYADLERPLSTGDEVAFIPPVSGG